MTEIRKLPGTDPRVENGPVQFGEDWPGTFIRGDSSFAYATYLQIILDASKADPISVAMLRGLLNDLRSSNLNRSVGSTSDASDVAIDTSAKPVDKTAVSKGVARDG